MASQHGYWGNIRARGEDQHTCKTLSWVDTDIPIREINPILGNAAGKGKECRYPYIFRLMKSAMPLFGLI
ncbi:MAG: hypothetical protein ACYCY7_12005 [Gallionella sp.]